MIKRRSETKRKQDSLPFEVIRAASGGDIESMERVIRYYDGYMKSLATKSMMDRSGNIHNYIDEDLYSRLHMRLILSVMKFNAE